MRNLCIPSNSNSFNRKNHAPRLRESIGQLAKMTRTALFKHWQFARILAVRLRFALSTWKSAGSARKSSVKGATTITRGSMPITNVTIFTDSPESELRAIADKDSIVTPRYSRKNAQDEIPRHTREQWLKKLERHGMTCHFCAIPLTNEMLTKDHLTPLCRGGSDTIKNIVPACLPCNQSKAWRTEKEFELERVRLSTASPSTRGNSKSKPYGPRGEVNFAHTVFVSPPPFPICRSLEEEDEPGMTLRLIHERDGNGASWFWRNPA